MGKTIKDRDIAIAPVITMREYLKFGFCKTRYQAFDCPNCGHALSAGPDYQPCYCDKCGQKLDFSNIQYEEEQFLGYAERT